MIKLTDMLNEILTEKKLCPKGRAYRRRRLAAGEKHSAYLSGRAVQVCNGRLKEEDDLDVHESLRDWFKKEDWVRIDTAGNITGPCGTMKKGNKTTRCLPRNKANSLTKDERAATSRKKAASEKQFVPNTKKAKVKLKELRQIINDIINELLHSNEDNIDESTLEGDDVNTKWYIVWPDGRYVHENELYQRPSDARPAGDDPMTPWYEVDAHYHGKFHPWAGSYHIQATSLDNAVEYAKSSPKLKVTDDEGSIEEYDVESKQDVKEFVQFMREYNQPLCEAEYHGRKVNLGKPMQGDVKKFKVYVKNPKGKVVKVNFGFGGSSAKGKRMTIKKNNPKRRKSFRARHNCDNPGPRTKARYWSCRAW